MLKQRSYVATRLEKEFEATYKSDDVQQLWIAMLIDIALRVIRGIVNGQPNLNHYRRTKTK